MKSKTLLVVLVIAITLGALAFRLPRLAERTMHGDEANQADKAGVLLEQGRYAYDPHQHHGPTLYYFTLPIAWLSGAHTFAETTEVTYRLVPVLFGVGLVLLLLGVRDGLPPAGILMAALLTAISPAMVYYSRYYIQEMLLVFFTFGTIMSGWRYAQKKSIGWAIACGLCAGLMFATKETCIIAFFSGAAGLAGAWIYSWLRDGARVSLRPLWNWKHLAACVVAFSAIAILLFSSFFTNARGPLDSILAFGPYITDRSTEDAHTHPWYYYLEILTYVKRVRGRHFWTEGFTLVLAAIGILSAILPKARPENRGIYLQRFLVFYAITIAAVYSYISYKTPWCILSMLHAFILLAGVGAAGLLSAMARLSAGKTIPRYALQALVWAGLAAGTAHLGYQAQYTCFLFEQEPRNPYVYAHPNSGPKQIGQRAEQIAGVHPDGHDMLIHVIIPSGDYWPLPWYLRRFPNVGYWKQDDGVPADLDAPMLITTRDLVSFLDKHLKDKYSRKAKGLRPGSLLIVYVRQDLYDAFQATLPGSPE